MSPFFKNTRNIHYKLKVAYDNDDGSCCKIGGVDGTSASSPALAGMISLINGYLIENGENALGFVNPLLYQMYQSDRDIFNDITDGDNKCNIFFCSN